MLFRYKAINQQGAETEGSIDAVNIDIAISSLQRRGFVITTIKPADQVAGLLGKDIGIFQRVKNKDVVILSRQMATLFSAQVSALRIFKLLAAEAENKALRVKLFEISEDIQGGATISASLAKHPKVFSSFYVNMVKAGEESGKLDETFQFLADYLDRNYEVTSKVKNALIYPAFVIFTFVAVMSLMLTVVIPKISSIIIDSGQEIPIYTKVVITISNLLVDFGPFILVGIVIAGFLLYQYAQTDAGKSAFSRTRIDFPYLGDLYRKLYLSRIADNLNTMLASGIPMIKALDLTANVVDNRIYEEIMRQTLESVKSGSALSDAIGKYPEIPGILVQMIRVGEETGELGNILKTLSRFYQREVMNAVDTLVDLIEPVMIVLLGLGVGFLLASVLIPIYNISSGI
ncbi:MAG: type II secretion system F family protein [Candidatus Taylorbacteria bacterium]|nr:type II secretion system F family protein [Candidatus Taylorbacteria bacterium]